MPLTAELASAADERRDVPSARGAPRLELLPALHDDVPPPRRHRPIERQRESFLYDVSTTVPPLAQSPRDVTPRT